MDRGLQQKELAWLLGVEPCVIFYWERGHRSPRIDRWPAIIEFLGYDPQPTPEGLPDRLRTLRRRLGLSQKEFARILKIDPATVRKWEGGKGMPMEWRGPQLTTLFGRVGILVGR